VSHKFPNNSSLQVQASKAALESKIRDAQTLLRCLERKKSEDFVPTTSENGSSDDEPSPQTRASSRKRTVASPTQIRTVASPPRKRTVASPAKRTVASPAKNQQAASPTQKQKVAKRKHLPTPSPTKKTKS